MTYALRGGAEKQFIVAWIALGASKKYVRTEGKGGGGPKAYIVREVA